MSRTGKTNQPYYRIVVAEHSAAVKGKYNEILGHYVPLQKPKKLEFNEERIRYWISKGAKPSDTVASLLKNSGVAGMEIYIEPRNKKKKKKGEQAAAAVPAEPAKSA